jgi:hypothetical protein
MGRTSPDSIQHEKAAPVGAANGKEKSHDATGGHATGLFP